jgi:hypothetical protein
MHNVGATYSYAPSSSIVFCKGLDNDQEFHQVDCLPALFYDQSVSVTPFYNAMISFYDLFDAYTESSSLAIGVATIFSFPAFEYWAGQGSLLT